MIRVASDPAEHAFTALVVKSSVMDYNLVTIVQKTPIHANTALKRSVDHQRVANQKAVVGRRCKSHHQSPDHRRSIPQKVRLHLLHRHRLREDLQLANLRGHGRRIPMMTIISTRSHLDHGKAQTRLLPQLSHRTHTMSKATQIQQDPLVDRLRVVCP